MVSKNLKCLITQGGKHAIKEVVGEEEEEDVVINFGQNIDPFNDDWHEVVDKRGTTSRRDCEESFASKAISSRSMSQSVSKR